MVAGALGVVVCFAGLVVEVVISAAPELNDDANDEVVGSGPPTVVECPGRAVDATEDGMVDEVAATIGEQYPAVVGEE